ncbi:hypothetical protein [Neobacillus kokaensis]|uniref:UDP-glucose 4-epimerase n=1 Tax=Neobacillus kokaensis TaxID=2759023 RepID=A0ABQ3N3Q1_9BACI|nr:hypothetical protein [Neobacillus kokaensis]GHH98490.1 UDP-glucose 4-epimerase [Neobacillus kokaensis]
MDKAIIIGIYNFVGFQICHTLLNKGIEVNGIHIDSKTDPFLEEKRLEIGRNANFVESSLSKWNVSENGNDLKKQILIFPIYDFYILREEAMLEKEILVNKVIQYLEEKKGNSNIVIIAPIQLLAQNLPSMNTLLEQMRGLDPNIQFIFLPAIFGPWQPSMFLFQQAIISSFQKCKISLSDREWTKDALFAADAAEAIFEIIESANPGSYLLESGKNNYWEKCAGYLAEISKLKDQRESIQIDSKIMRVPVKCLTPITEALNFQKEHVKMHYHWRP